MAKININISKKVFNDAYLDQLENYTTRFNVFYGGAGSGKSHFVVQKMILKYLKFNNRKCLVVRKVANTLRDSIFALFKTVLSDWQLFTKCQVLESYMTIILPNGSQFIFKGLDDQEKIKSIANIDDIVIEECTELVPIDFTQLNLRLRSKNIYNQIHLMFNPISKANWVYKKWFANGYDTSSTMILHTAHQHNKFLPQEYIDSLLAMKDENPALYEVYALGKFATLDKLVYDNWTVTEFDYREILRTNKNAKAYFGLDYGYTNDPTAFICVIVDRVAKNLYVFDEFYETGMLNNQIADKIKYKGYAKEIITADSAEQKSTQEIRIKEGITRIRPARKGKDSVLNGIQYIKQYKMFVHSNCVHTIEELENYSWVKDKETGEYINEPIDSYNHLMDAFRYALEDLTRRALLNLPDEEEYDEVYGTGNPATKYKKMVKDWTGGSASNSYINY